VGNRSATDADVKQAVISWAQIIYNGLFCTLVLWWENFLKNKGEYVAVLFFQPASQL
jgi:hypothetical protein